MPVSILFQNSKDRVSEEELIAPDFFVNLNFDKIVASITADKQEYNLTPFFYMPLHDTDAVIYRHEVMQDLENPSLLAVIETFAEGMRQVIDSIAKTQQDFHDYQKKRWLLNGADIYIKAVTKLTNDLSKHRLKSRGFLAFTQHLDRYVKSKQFIFLTKQVNELITELNAIRYEVLIEGLRVEVRHYQDEPDYSSEIQDIFQRFSDESDNQYQYSFRDDTKMNQVEGRILDLVAQIYSDTFLKLTSFHNNQKNFIDDSVALFDREIQFYIAYLKFIAKLKKAKLSFCYPKVSSTNKELTATKSFDLALADKLITSGKMPVTNDFYLKGAERIIVVSGPNQGGKTTFARMFGQLNYLASLGLLTPGNEGQFYLADRLLTHFEKEEKMTNLRGKLEDDLLRMHDILEVATPHSIIIINEIFTSTTLNDAILLSKKIATLIMKLDVLCVWVTFIDEISILSNKTVSMVSDVVVNKPALRTFKITRRSANGLAYAISIAEKYKLTSVMLERRIKI